MTTTRDAELLVRLANDMRKFEHHAVGSLRIDMDEVRKIIAACDGHSALLSEIAALRGERDDYRLRTAELTGERDALKANLETAREDDLRHLQQATQAAVALRDLTELLAGFVQDEDDARSNPLGGVSLGGLMDCRDNSGCVYQSADLAARIAKARVLTLPSAPNQAKEAGE